MVSGVLVGVADALNKKVDARNALPR